MWNFRAIFFIYVVPVVAIAGTPNPPSKLCRNALLKVIEPPSSYRILRVSKQAEVPVFSKHFLLARSGQKYTAIDFDHREDSFYHHIAAEFLQLKLKAEGDFETIVGWGGTIEFHLEFLSGRAQIYKLEIRPTNIWHTDDSLLSVMDKVIEALRKQEVPFSRALTVNYRGYRDDTFLYEIP